MTGKTFKLRVILITAIAFWISGSALFFSAFAEKEMANALRSVPTVVIPIAGAWLAFFWQRRVAFTKALFDVWQKTVITVQDTIAYISTKNKDQNAHEKILKDLSCRIDDMRGVFRNVGEPNIFLSDREKIFVIRIKDERDNSEYSKILSKYESELKKYVGLYPFESLKQIYTATKILGYENPSVEQCDVTCRVILALWGILRGELLKELDRDFPQYSDTPYSPR